MMSSALGSLQSQYPPFSKFDWEVKSADCGGHCWGTPAAGGAKEIVGHMAMRARPYALAVIRERTHEHALMAEGRSHDHAVAMPMPMQG